VYSFLSVCTFILLLLTLPIGVQTMAARRMGRSLENRRAGSKQLPTILSRKRKSDEDDPSQPVGIRLFPPVSLARFNFLFVRQYQIPWISFLMLAPHLQDIQSFFNTLPKSQNLENINSGNNIAIPSFSSLQNRPPASR
jgi:hypothetical protein